MSEVVAEKILVEAAVAGDSAAVEELLLANFTPLERHIAAKLPDHARRYFGADDILQICFAQVFRDISGFSHRGDGSFFSWLRAIADHRIIDALRKIDQGDVVRASIGNFNSLESLAELLDAVCRDSASPIARAENFEAIRALQVAIAGLPEDQREVICLNCLEQKSVEQVAAQTGRTEAAVRGLVHRGKKNLRDAMGRSSRWFGGR